MANNIAIDEAVMKNGQWTKCRWKYLERPTLFDQQHFDTFLVWTEANVGFLRLCNQGWDKKKILTYFDLYDLWILWHDVLNMTKDASEFEN